MHSRSDSTLYLKRNQTQSNEYITLKLPNIKIKFHRKKEFKIQRLDPATDESLRAWSADKYLLSAIHNSDVVPNQLGLYNDRFGYLACSAHHLNLTIICTHASQKKAIELNLQSNQLSLIKAFNSRCAL